VNLLPLQLHHQHKLVQILANVAPRPGVALDSLVEKSKTSAAVFKIDVISEKAARCHSKRLLKNAGSEIATAFLISATFSVIHFNAILLSTVPCPSFVTMGATIPSM
jgi:hypothetical protein